MMTHIIAPASHWPKRERLRNASLTVSWKLHPAGTKGSLLVASRKSTDMRAIAEVLHAAGRLFNLTPYGG